MKKGIGFLLSLFISICTAIFIMRFLGVTMKDVDYFITYGFKKALEILSLFGGIIHRSLQM